MRGHYPSTDLSREIRDMLDQGVAGVDEGARRQAAKDMILAEMALEQNNRFGFGQVRDDFSNLALAEFSDKTFWYDPAGQWEYSMMEVSGIDSAPFREATTTAVMDRPLNLSLIHISEPTRPY